MTNLEQIKSLTEAYKIIMDARYATANGPTAVYSKVCRISDYIDNQVTALVKEVA